MRFINRIDKEKIGGKSIKFDKKYQENWQIAMKNYLENMNYIIYLI